MGGVLFPLQPVWPNQGKPQSLSSFGGDGSFASCFGAGGRFRLVTDGCAPDRGCVHPVRVKSAISAEARNFGKVGCMLGLCFGLDVGGTRLVVGRGIDRGALIVS